MANGVGAGDQRKALEACVAAVRALVGADGNTQRRALEELRTANFGLRDADRFRLAREVDLWRLASNLESIAQLLLYGRLPVETTAVALLEVLDGLDRLENEHEGDALRAKLEALEAQASPPAQPPPMPAWVERLERTSTLHDYERYRLEENLRQGRPLHILGMPVDDQLRTRLDHIRAAVEIIAIIQRDVPPGHGGARVFALIAADDARVQLGSLLESGVELTAPEHAALPDRRGDELAWLHGCWAAEIGDANALARLHETLAASSAPTVEPWRDVGRITVALAKIPELKVEARRSLHRDTVMDLAVAPSGLGASIDFSGRWSVWTQARLREQIHGDFGHEARAISLSDDGARIAALLNLGKSALYNYDAFIVDLGEGEVRRCAGESVERLRWSPRGEFLLVGNMVGYRIHDAAGALICADESPKGLSATCFVRGELRCIRRNVLGGVELGTGRALPCLDLTIFDPEDRAHYRQAGLDVHEAGDLAALGPGGNALFVLELASGRPIVNLVFEGVQIVGMKLAFDTSGRYLLMSATHIRGTQVTHLVYDGCRGAVIGRLTTAEGTFHHHARVVMSSDCKRVFAADGDKIIVARLPAPT